MVAFIQLFAAATPPCKTVIDAACSLPNPGSAQGSGYLDTVLKIVFAIAASVAVLMIAINGFRYIVARGEPGATASAKDGILYSVVGLLITMVAYSIVVFVVRGLN